jgi:hypothetical protein
MTAMPSTQADENQVACDLRARAGRVSLQHRRQRSAATWDTPDLF